MKWFVIFLLLAIPAIGLYFIYVAYRIHFKADYSYIKSSEGNAPMHPDIYALSIARAYFIGGTLMTLSILLVTKFSIFDIAKFVALVGTLVKLHTYALTKGA